MTSKNIRYSIYFSSSFIKFIFLTLTIKSWRFLWLSICILPHLGSSVIQYHLYPSALFISPKSIKYILLEYKRQIDLHNHKKLTKVFKIISTAVWNFKWKYINSQNIWNCLRNTHNLMNLVSSFLCEWNPLWCGWRNKKVSTFMMFWTVRKH